MIKILLVILLTTCSTLTFAQMNGDSKYSFGVSGYTYMEMPKTLNQSNNRYINSSFSSYMIKFNDNLFSYRLTGGYLNKSTQFSTDDPQGLANGKVKDFFFKAGFEKNFTYSAFQPYFAFDLGYRNNKFGGMLNDSHNSNSLVDIRKEGFTVTPVFGIKISPVKAISFFAETNLEFFYAFGKGTTDAQDGSESQSSNTFKKGEFLYNPVTAGIQIHLGKSN